MLPENHLSQSRFDVPEYHEQLSGVLPVQDDPFDQYLDLWFLHPEDFLSEGVTDQTDLQAFVPLLTDCTANGEEGAHHAPSNQSR
jgi:hypothetical protein